jgi:pyruvate/2-oxoglutarate dehydrogenase complex dihydrolipoamide dehydrogenase (E3) component
MPDVLRPDLCVIGAGSAGLSVVAAAAMMRVPVVLVEKGDMGGDCLNYGCVPSKALIAAAHAAHAMRTSEPFGIRAVQPSVDYAAVHAHVRSVIAAIAPNDSQARFEALGAKVIRAAGKFTAKDTFEAGGSIIKARRFIVATGSSPASLPIAGLETVRGLTNESIFELTVLPSHLIIIGGGPIGVELAQAYRRLGSNVTILEAAAVLGREDPEFSEVVLRRLRQEGVAIREKVLIARVEPDPAGVCVVLTGEGAEEKIVGSHLLVAAGRKPNVENLGLKAAQVQYSSKGIVVSSALRTGNRRIYAIGDVIGGAQFTHAANYHAGLVVRAALFRLPVKVQPHLIPRVTYSDPEIAVAGLTESEARSAHGKINVLRWPFSENDRAQTERAIEGHVKIITAGNGRVLGAGIVGRHAGELISMWQLVISRGLKLADVAGLVLPYPTLSEASKRAATLSYASSLRNPWLGRTLRFLRRFG